MMSKMWSDKYEPPSNAGRARRGRRLLGGGAVAIAGLLVICNGITAADMPAYLTATVGACIVSVGVVVVARGIARRRGQCTVCGRDRVRETSLVFYAPGMQGFGLGERVELRDDPIGRAVRVPVPPETGWVDLIQRPRQPRHGLSTPRSAN